MYVGRGPTIKNSGSSASSISPTDRHSACRWWSWILAILAAIRGCIVMLAGTV
jgi:hypothetical protein